MPWRGAEPDDPFPYPSLGWLLLDWWADYLPSPRDDSEPLIFTDEQARGLVEWYQLDPKSGRYVHRRGCSRRSKGWGKSPREAAKAIAALAGPVVFDGWDANGDPVGRPLGTRGGDPNPWVQIAAVSEDQTDNTYSVLHELLGANDGQAADELRIDVGLTRCYLMDRPGKLEPVTASAGTREGQPVTEAVLDEALALDTRLPTPTGWTTMGQVHAGDWLFGSDGNPVQVVKTTDVQHGRHCYRVTFADGSSVVSSDGHLWSARPVRQGRAFREHATGDMAKRGGRWRVPLAAPLEFEAVDLPVDPYSLGAWLGDGSTGQMYVTAGTDDAEEVASYLRQGGFRGEVRRPPNRACRIALSEKSGYQGATRNAASKALYDLPCFRDKHVPERYFSASYDQRADLVRGLMDTDGHVSREGSCSFAGRSQLAGDLVRLLRGLGQVPSIRWVTDSRSRDGGYARVCFTPRQGLVPFRLERKVRRVRDCAELGVTIVAIEPVESVPVKCVAVEADDHLFAIGDGHVLTHNTHLWTPQNGGVKLARTLRRNVAKMNGRSYETTNSFVPGENSVAEATHKAVQKGAPGIYYDAVEAPPVKEEHSDRKLKAALKVAYGDAWWVNLDRLVADIRDPDMTWEDASRFFFNWNVDDRLKAVETKLWEALGPKQDGELIAVPAGARVALGFDGSISDDCTALIGCAEVDGKPFTFEIEVWKRPENAQKGWRIPRTDVLKRVRETFEFYNVGLMLCDPAKWQTEIEAWAEEYGEETVLFFDTNQPTRMARACDRFSTALAEGAYRHDGAEDLTAQVLAMHKRKVRIRDEDDDGRTRFVFVKGPDRLKIDAGIGAVLALEAFATMPEAEQTVEPFALWGE